MTTSSPFMSTSPPSPREVEAIYETAEVVAKLRRLADALETGAPFRIRIAGERFRVPVRAQFNIAHERGEDEEEIEFQLVWEHDAGDTADVAGEPV